MPGPLCTDIKYSYRQIRELIRVRQAIYKAIPDPLSPFYATIARVENRVSINIGFKLPRPMTLLLKLVGLSPGELSVWHDAESGFFTEARERPGASPVYHHVTDDVAIALLTGKLTHELEAELMKPDEYLGE